MLFELLSDLLKINDLLFVVKSQGVTSEIRSNSLNIKQKEQWITIGDSDGPCHMHVNSELVKYAQFIIEEKPERTSYSVRFFDENNKRILGVFFTKMYDKEMKIELERKKLYEQLLKKYGKEKIYFT